MKTHLFFAVTLLFFGLNSCSKKSSGDITPNDKREGTISVQINGTTWSGTCGAVDAKIGTSVNVTIVGNKEGKNGAKDDVLTITLIGYTGTGSYPLSANNGSGISLIYNDVLYSNDKKSTDQPIIKITESALPTTPLGPGKLAGEFSGTLKSTDGKTVQLTNGKFQTTDIL
ncbi:DUF6252 family protein [Dyadobacter sp. 32]|uniref:DUF6252 family protein n=1 Tax=Dyadobacter sp. 32 TaxID=538966 RepID=UPI0011EE3182